MRNNYNKQVEIALQKNIYKREEINESNIEPFPIDSFELDEINKMLKNDMVYNKDKKRLKEAGCQCCIIY